MRIGLVSCVKSKLEHRAPARDLYTSALFRGARCSVERSCGRWFILSALHGLVDPDEVLEPYEKTLATASRQERRRWSQAVLMALEQELGAVGPHSFEIHAGAAYARYGLLEGLSRAGADVELPLDGLTMGQRLAFYKRTGCL